MENRKTIMIYFSSILKTNPKYKVAANNLFAALDLHNEPFEFIENTSDIWVRDFMPVKGKSDSYISFRYEPSYLKGKKYKDKKSNYKQDIREQFSLPLNFSDINLDGGNVVMSHSKSKAIISNRVLSKKENPHKRSTEIISEIERLLGTQVIIIPSLRRKWDMTGHADGMVRFIDENTVVGNDTGRYNKFELKIKKTLKKNGISVIDFPYFESKGISAIGSYLNYLETEKHIFLPIFGVDMDKKAIEAAHSIFHKKIVPVNINEIARDGGVLNCISWELT